MLYFNVVISYEIENKTEKKCKQKKDCVTPQTSGPRSSPPTTPYDSLTLLMFFFCFFFLLFFSSSSPRLKVPSSLTLTASRESHPISLKFFFSWPAHGRLSFTHWPPIRVLEASSYPLGVARSIDEVNIYIYIYI